MRDEEVKHSPELNFILNLTRQTCGAAVRPILDIDIEFEADGRI
jgi:hypothetical protein